ncbi:MAG: AraC family transcriptional regulator [Hyphomonas sp.]
MQLSLLLGGVSSLIVFACLLLATFLLAVKSDNRRGNAYFAGFLLLTAFDAGGWLIASAGLSGTWLDALRQASVFLQMPLFLWFIQSTCFTGFQHGKRDWLHALPFLAALTLTLPGSQLGGGASAFLTRPESLLIVAGAHIQYYAYIAVIVRTLMEFRRIFRDQCSDVRSGVFRWLSQLTAVSFIVHGLVLLRSILGFSQLQAVFDVLQIAGALAALAVVTWFSLKAMLQPELFRGIDKALLRAAQIARGTPPPGQGAVNLLLAYMDRAEPYLDPALSLPDLAAQMKTTPRELSELINQALGLHFFDFVNRYRIERAKEMLAAGDQTVLEILYAVGFNSKSSFNTAFRKHANMTPTRYRQSLPR